MIVHAIAAKDFWSFQDVKLEFPKTGLILVTGWDEDLERHIGAGKSGIFNALVWCLYDKLPKDVKVSELIRRGQTACSVTVSFSIDDVWYVVTRKRPSGLELTIAGEKQKGTPKFLQACLEQAIGLSYDQFLITSYFPQKGDDSRFLKQNDAKAKDFLGAILNFNKTEAAYKKLHIQLKELETMVAVKQSEVASCTNTIGSLASIASVPITPMPEKEAILKVKAEMEEVTRLTAQPPDTSAVDAEIEKVKGAVQKVQTAKFEAAQCERQIADKNRKVEHVQSSEAHFLTCPSCSADLLESNGKLVEFDEVAAEDLKKQKVEQLNADIQELRQKLEKWKLLADKEAAFQQKLDDLKAKRIQARHDYDMAVQRKAHLSSQMQAFKQAITARQQEGERLSKVQVQMKEQQATLLASQEKLVALEGEYMLLSAAKAVMSPTGAIAYSLDSVMADLNDEVAQYLDIFSHNTMTYKITSGDDKAKVTHTLSKGGYDVSVGSLSGGEERGLILSVDLGLGNVIANRSGVNLPSVLMLDECFEGLDYVGKERILDALREIAKDRCIVVIDHSTEFSALFDQSIKVVKKSDVSRVEVS